MTNKSADSALEGNTKTSKARTKEVKRYCFTLHNWTQDELNKMIKIANSACEIYVFGKEICPETERPHIQGYINLKKKKSWEATKKLFGLDRLHIESCNGSEKANIEYCMEDGDYITNIKEDEKLIIIQELKPWMKKLNEIINEPANDRHVYWIWEPNGRVGKSQYCKYLCANHDAIYIDEGKKTDLINIVYNKKTLNSRTIICIDIPRDNENNVSYKAIEQFKNGMICNTKYETGMRLFNAPHIIIFCNYPPIKTKLSSDRWKIYEIINDDITV